MKKAIPCSMVFSLAFLVATGGTACRGRSADVPSAGPAGEQPAAPAAEIVPERVRLSPAAIAEAGVATWEVQPVDLEHLLVLNGSVGYDENRLLQVAANVRGRVVSIPVDLGEWVPRGTPLLTVDSVELGRAREDLARAVSNLRVAQRAYERARALVDGKAISTGEFLEREGDYLGKKAAAEAAERTLHLYGEDDSLIQKIREGTSSHDFPSAAGQGAALTLRAPFDGRVIERKVTPGSLFEAMQPLVTVANLSSVWVFLQAYEKDLALLRETLSVRIRTEAYPEETFDGRIDFLGSVVDAATRTVKVRATVRNPGERLRPGMFVKAQVEVPRPEEESRRILAVPQAALQTLEGRMTVFVQVEPGVFERRLVETGHTFEEFTEILSGVKPHETIVTEGSFILKSEFARATLVEED